MFKELARHFCLGIIFLSLLPRVSAQEVAGTFTDSLNRPFEYLKVLVMDQAGISGGAFTDSLGQFDISLPTNGTYKLVALSLNNDTIFRNENLVVQGAIDLGTILLKDAGVQADEVVISARASVIIRKVDRVIFNVENTITGVSGTALDALKLAPGIRVRERSIEMIGKSNVLMYLDGRPLKISGDDLFNFLKSIPASDVKRIEVISNPPANYEAQGNSGIVDIILKRSRNTGLNGSIRGNMVQATYFGASGGGSFNYAKNKILCYGGLNIGDGNISPRGDRTITYPTQTWDENMWSKTGQYFLNGRLGMDFFPTQSLRFGFRYWGGYREPRIYERLGTEIRSQATSELDSTLITESSVLSKVADHYLNGNLQWDLDTNDRQMIVNVDVFNYDNHSTQIYATQILRSLFQPIGNQSFENGVDQQIKSVAASLDFKLPFDFIDIKTGAKVSFIQNNSAIASYNLAGGGRELDTTQTSEFQYAENTQALYLSGEKAWDKIELQLGVRAEYTQTEGVSITTNTVTPNEYLKVFPTAYLSYAPSDDHFFDLTYGRRIDRPAYWRLNPFRRFNSSYSYTVGNPFLQPSFFGNLEASYTYLDALTASVYYSRGNQGFNEITFVEAGSPFQITTQQNFLTTHSMGVTLSYFFAVGDFWESSNDVTVYYTQSLSDNTATLPKVEGYTAYASTNNSFLFNEEGTFSGELNFYYQFPEVDGIDRFKRYLGLSAGLRWKLLNQKLNLTCEIADALASQKYTFTNTINSVAQTNTKYWDTRQLVVGLKYDFGKAGKLKPTNSSSNNEEKNRLNQ